ncbi:hypothetical protein [Lentzea sp. E54]|uniref:hypothetical protein n=1 Tax=Lentzea xerophila TaxID=3435883 RepID=UPI003DA5DAC4
MSLAMWRRGRGGEYDPFAMQVLRQAADRGDVTALEQLATMLERSGDNEGAERLARKAADLGSWEAMFSVAEWRDVFYPEEAEALIANLPEHMRIAAVTRLALGRDDVGDYSGAEELALGLLASGHPRFGPSAGGSGPRGSVGTS